MSSHAILTAEDHRDLRVRSEAAADLGDAVMGCLTFPDEFRRVQAEFPILFRLNPERDSFSALAMFGLEDGENLFLAEEGWTATYRPLALSIQPFLVGRNASGDGPGQVHIDMASPRIAKSDADGVRIFDEDGQPTPYLEQVASMLGELDEGYRASAAFFDALNRHQLLQPMAFEVPVEGGATNRLVGYHAIDEDRLRALDGAALGELHGAGHLMPIFMALASLGHLATLARRKVQRMDRG
ncbi:MAG: SapC family protein [Sphingomonadaceae bacterium]